MHQQDSLIIYPKVYNKRGDASLHSVVGLDDNNNEVNVKLRIPESTTKQNPPSILEFSRTDFKAKQACIASETNSRDNHEGILLFTGVKEDGLDRHKRKCYTAQWAYVLAQDCNSASPVIGFGRMHIAKKSYKVFCIQKKLEQLLDTKNPSQKDISALSSELHSPKNFDYLGLMYLFSQTLVVEPLDLKKGNFGSIYEKINSYNAEGVIAGFLVRYVKNGVVMSTSSEVEEYIPYYNWAKHAYSLTNELIDGFAKNVMQGNSGAMLNKCDEVWITPICSVKCGKVGVSHYSKPDKYEKLLQFYYDKDNKPVVRRTALKPSFIEEAEKQVLNRMYSLDGFIYSPNELSLDGETSMKTLDTAGPEQFVTQSHSNVVQADWFSEATAPPREKRAPTKKGFAAFVDI